MRDSIDRALLVGLLTKLRRADGFIALVLSFLMIDRLVKAIYDGGLLNWSLLALDIWLVAYWGREWYRATEAVDMLAAGKNATVEREP